MALTPLTSNREFVRLTMDDVKKMEEERVAYEDKLSLRSRIMKVRKIKYAENKRKQYGKMPLVEKRIYIHRVTEHHKEWRNSLSPEKKAEFFTKKRGWFKKWYNNLLPEKKKIYMAKIVKKRKDHFENLGPEEKKKVIQSRNEYSKNWCKNLPPEKRFVRLLKARKYQKLRYANLPPEQKEELKRRGRIRAKLFYHQKREKELSRKSLVDQRRVTFIPPEPEKQKRHQENTKHYIGKEEHRYEVEHQYDLSPKETKALREKLRAKRAEQQRKISGPRRYITHRGKILVVLSEAEKEKIEGLSALMRGEALNNYGERQKNDGA